MNNFFLFEGKIKFPSQDITNLKISDIIIEVIHYFTLEITHLIVSLES